MAMVPAVGSPTPEAALGELGVFDCFDVTAMANGLADIDVDFPRLHGFRYLALQFNLKQPVFKRSLFHFDEISEAEAPLERPRGDAAVHIFHLVLFLIHLTTYYKRVLVNCDIDLFGLEARDGQRNAIGVLTGPNDIA